MSDGQGKYYFIFHSGLIDPQHIEAIGPAFWVYMWMINKTTQEWVDIDGEFGVPGDTIGVVLGSITKGDPQRGIKSTVKAQPVTAELLAEDLGLSKSSVNRDLKRLVEKGYLVRLNRVSRGVMYGVRRSNKWAAKVVQSAQPSTDRDKVEELLARLFKGMKNGVPDGVKNEVLRLHDNGMAFEVVREIIFLASDADNIAQYLRKLIRDVMQANVKSHDDFKAYRDRFTRNFRTRADWERHLRASEDGMKRYFELSEAENDPEKKREHLEWYRLCKEQKERAENMLLEL